MPGKNRALLYFVVGKVEHDDAEVDTVDGLFRVAEGQGHLRNGEHGCRCFGSGAWDAHDDRTRNICDGRNTDDVKERALRPTASGKQTKSYIASEGWKREATNDRPINLGVGINRERREVGG